MVSRGHDATGDLLRLAASVSTTLNTARLNTASSAVLANLHEDCERILAWCTTEQQQQTCRPHLLTAVSALRDALVPFANCMDDAVAERDAEATTASATESAIRRVFLFERLVPARLLQHCHAARTLLVYGPPGTGKSRAVRRASEAARLPLVTVTAGDLMSRWVGSSEARLRRGFRWACDHAPAVLFFDEVDALFSRRSTEGESEVGRRIKTELLCLIQMALDRDPTSPPVFVVAATNLPWDLDPALVRRFHQHTYAALPTAVEREELVKECVCDALRDEGDFDVAAIVGALEGCSHAEVVSCCRAAVRAQITHRFCDGVPAAAHAPTSDGIISTTTLVDEAHVQHRAATEDDLKRFEAWAKRRCS